MSDGWTRRPPRFGSWRTMEWTGWIEADLYSFAGGSAFTTIEISVRIDIVTFWIGSRTLAVADRDALRSWVRRPSEPLHVDDLALVREHRRLHAHIDGKGPYVFCEAAASRLFEVV